MPREPPGHQALCGQGQDGVGERDEQDDAHEGHVEHLGLAQHRPEGGVEDLVEGAPGQGGGRGQPPGGAVERHGGEADTEADQAADQGGEPERGGQEEVGGEPGHEPHGRPARRAAEQAGQDGQEDHDVRMDPTRTDLEHQRLLDDQEGEEHQGEAPDVAPAHELGPQSRTET